MRGLAVGKHALRIVVAGVKGSRSATVSQVVLDRLVIG